MSCKSLGLQLGGEKECGACQQHNLAGSTAVAQRSPQAGCSELPAWCEFLGWRRPVITDALSPASCPRDTCKNMRAMRHPPPPARNETQLLVTPPAPGSHLLLAREVLVDHARGRVVEAVAVGHEAVVVARLVDLGAHLGGEDLGVVCVCGGGEELCVGVVFAAAR